MKSLNISTGSHPALTSLFELKEKIETSQEQEDQLLSLISALSETTDLSEQIDKMKQQASEYQNKSKDVESQDDLYQNNINTINALKQSIQEKKESEKRGLIDLINKKRNFSETSANRNLLKARGIYRKRKSHQGNAKLHLREKYSKKVKTRKNMVKEFTKKPDIYSGEATGIRRDLIRSTKLS